MKEELHHHLDGELPREDLGEEARQEAEAWDRLLGAFRTEIPSASAPPWLESRVMAEIEALPEPNLIKRAWSWIMTPRPIRLSPLTVGVVTAALATILVVGRQGGGPQGVAPMGSGISSMASMAGGPDREGVVYVQFALEAPGATSVAVAGDFDDWEGAFELEDLNGDGVWSGRVPVHPGVHAYMFLVDGSTWMTDPNAERYSEDGFGNRNAILAVAAPAT